MAFTATQDALQSPVDTLDLAHVIRGAIEHYSRMFEATDGIDPATQDMLTTILVDEQNHLRTPSRGSCASTIASPEPGTVPVSDDRLIQSPAG